MTQSKNCLYGCNKVDLQYNAYLNMDTNMKTMCTKIHSQDLEYNILHVCKRGILTKTSVYVNIIKVHQAILYSCVVI